MNESALATKTELKGLEFWKTDPGAKYPVAMTIDPKPGYTLGDGLDQAAWNKTIIAEQMTVLYLDAASEEPTSLGIIRTDKETVNVSLTRRTPTPVSANHSSATLLYTKRSWFIRWLGS